MLLLVFFFGWLPLYWNQFYLAADTGLGKKLFAIISGTLFAVGIITLIPLGVCIHILSALLMMLSTMSTEAAANSIYNPSPNPQTLTTLTLTRMTRPLPTRSTRAWRSSACAAL